MGEDLEVVLKATNTSAETRTLSGKLALSTMYYTGVHYRNVKFVSIDDIVLGKGQSMLTINMIEIKVATLICLLLYPRKMYLLGGGILFSRCPIV